MNTLGEGGIFKEENSISITQNQISIAFLPLKDIMKYPPSYTYTYTSKITKDIWLQWSPYSMKERTTPHHEVDFLNYMLSPTNPFTQGFSSLPSVSESFTPMNKFNIQTKQGEMKKTKKMHETQCTITLQHKDYNNNT